MELIARLVVIALVVLPLVVLVLRGTRFGGSGGRGAGGADGPHDELAGLVGGPGTPADADARRLRAELAAAVAHREAPAQPPAWPRRFSAEIAS